MTPPTTDRPAGDAGRIELRPATDDDRPFLLAVYAGTRTEELALVPWSDEQKDAFLGMQFDAQDSWYRQIYPDGQFLVVVLDGNPVGRLYLARGEAEIRIVDIALLPEHRSQGIGSRLLEDILAAADRDRLPVTSASSRGTQRDACTTGWASNSRRRARCTTPSSVPPVS